MLRSRPRSAGALAVIAVLVAAACGGRHARPAEVIRAVPDGTEFTTDVDSSFGAGFEATLKDAFDSTDIAVGVVTPHGANGPCQSAVVAAFRQSRRVADLVQLRDLAAALAAKDSNAFVATKGIDGWLLAGDQSTCAEAVLAAERDRVFVYGYGSADVVARFGAHLPSAFS